MAMTSRKMRKGCILLDTKNNARRTLDSWKPTPSWPTLPLLTTSEVMVITISRCSLCSSSSSLRWWSTWPVFCSLGRGFAIFISSWPENNATPGRKTNSRKFRQSLTGRAAGYWSRHLINMYIQTWLMTTMAHTIGGVQQGVFFLFFLFFCFLEGRHEAILLRVSKNKAILCRWPAHFYCCFFATSTVKLI